MNLDIEAILDDIENCRYGNVDECIIIMQENISKVIAQFQATGDMVRIISVILY